MPAASREPRRARLFRNGRSQAVRLPKEFRFPGEEVSVRREGEAVILEPIGPSRWPRGYWRRLGEMHPDTETAPMRPVLEDVDMDGEGA